MGVARRELLEAAAAVVAGVAGAGLGEAPLGTRARRAWAAKLPQAQPGDLPDA